MLTGRMLLAEHERIVTRNLSQKLSRLGSTVLLLALGLLVAPLFAEAKPPGKEIPRIGELDVASCAVNSHRREALLQGRRERGWVEGQNVAIEYRSTC